MQTGDSDSSTPVSSETLVQATRQQFLLTLCAGIAGLDKCVVERLQRQEETGSRPDRAGAQPDWPVAYMALRRQWAQGLLQTWHSALRTVECRSSQWQTATSMDELALVSEDVLACQIAAARLNAESVRLLEPLYSRLCGRLQHLGLTAGDVFEPLQPATDLVRVWHEAGLSLELLYWLSDDLLEPWGGLLGEAYQAAHRFLDAQGIAPEPDQPLRGSAGRSHRSSGDRAGAAAGPEGSARPRADAASPPGSAAHATPDRAAGWTGDTPVTDFGTLAIEQLQTLQEQVRAGLAGAMDRSPRAGIGGAAHERAPETQLAQVLQNYPALQIVQSPVTLEEQHAGEHLPEVQTRPLMDAARRQAQAILEQTGRPSEKAVIELVALTFQSVLAEERVPAAIRVLFARLQVPVLRVALIDPGLFGRLEHPARQLIDRMGGVAMGFDGASLQTGALEHEARRLVQMIEQYPDAGVRVFVLALSEFEKFLRKHLSEKEFAATAISVARRIEEKQTLLVRFTIELRELLKDVPVRPQVRNFLFKTWAEVLAMAAVRSGIDDRQTIEFRQVAALLIWATSAKRTRAQRCRVVQMLPGLEQRLRAGLSLVGAVDEVQEAAIARILLLVQQAFLSDSQAVSAEKLKALATGLEKLHALEAHEAVQGEGVPLSRESIEQLLGRELAAGVVVMEDQPGRSASPIVIDWVRARSVGEWFEFPGGAPGRTCERVQYIWHSRQRHLHLLEGENGRHYLLGLTTFASHCEAGSLRPLDGEGLMLRASRTALSRLDQGLC